MRKVCTIIFLITGGFLLLYPTVCQSLSAAAQRRALQEDPSIMGQLYIPALELTLPIRAGTSEAVLREGIGLLDGTGFSTHAVLCGHRGLPEAVLFRDLDRLEPGDRFSVTTGGQTILYQIFRIQVVSPEDTAALLPEDALQLCTLLTCTPYGINSHRLLVTGQQVR